MAQEQNNNQPSGAESNQRKRHYREIGGPVRSDAPQRADQNSENRSGGNRPPRNNQRRTTGGQPQTSTGSAQRQRRPRNKRPANQHAVKQGPVERNESVRQNEKAPVNAVKPAADPDQRADNPRKQYQDKNLPRDQQRADQPRSGGQKSRQPARWEKRVRTEENVDDVRRDIERIEKEIWLEIASIHTIKLDF
jgi:hypothetical protein